MPLIISPKKQVLKRASMKHQLLTNFVAPFPMQFCLIKSQSLHQFLVSHQQHLSTYKRMFSEDMINETKTRVSFSMPWLLLYFFSLCLFVPRTEAKFLLLLLPLQIIAEINQVGTWEGQSKERMI